MRAVSVASAGTLLAPLADHDGGATTGLLLEIAHETVIYKGDRKTMFKSKALFATLVGSATVVALIAAAIAFAASPVKGAKYAGHLKVASSEKVTFKVSPSGTMVTSVRVKPYLPNKCGNGGTPPPEVSKPAKIKNGKFSAVVKAELSNGLVSGMVTVTGKFLPGGKERGVVKAPLPGAPECAGNFPYTTAAKKGGK